MGARPEPRVPPTCYSCVLLWGVWVCVGGGGGVQPPLTYITCVCARVCWAPSSRVVRLRRMENGRGLHQPCPHASSSRTSRRGLPCASHTCCPPFPLPTSLWGLSLSVCVCVCARVSVCACSGLRGSVTLREEPTGANISQTFATVVCSLWAIEEGGSPTPLPQVPPYQTSRGLPRTTGSEAVPSTHARGHRTNVVRTWVHPGICDTHTAATHPTPTALNFYGAWSVLWLGHWFALQLCAWRIVSSSVGVRRWCAPRPKGDRTRRVVWPRFRCPDA